MFVDIISSDDNVWVSGQNFAKGNQFISAVHGPRWVGRTVEDDQPGIRGNRARQLCWCHLEALLDTAGHYNRCRIG